MHMAICSGLIQTSSSTSELIKNLFAKELTSAASSNAGIVGDMVVSFIPLLTRTFEIAAYLRSIFDFTATIAGYDLISQDGFKAAFI